MAVNKGGSTPNQVTQVAPLQQRLLPRNNPTGSPSKGAQTNSPLAARPQNLRLQQGGQAKGSSQPGGK